MNSVPTDKPVCCWLRLRLLHGIPKWLQDPDESSLAHQVLLFPLRTPGSSVSAVGCVTMRREKFPLPSLAHTPVRVALKKFCQCPKVFQRFLFCFVCVIVVFNLKTLFYIWFRNELCTGWTGTAEWWTSCHKWNFPSFPTKNLSQESSDLSWKSVLTVLVKK